MACTKYLVNIFPSGCHSTLHKWLWKTHGIAHFYIITIRLSNSPSSGFPKHWSFPPNTCRSM